MADTTTTTPQTAPSTFGFLDGNSYAATPTGGQQFVGYTPPPTAPTTTSSTTSGGTPTITPTDLSSKAVTVPPPAPPTDTGAGLVAGTQASPTLDDYVKALTPTDTPLDQQQNALVQRVVDLSGQDTGKGAYQQQENQQYGVDNYTQQLNDLNGQITTKTAQFTADQEKLQNQTGQIQSDYEGESARIQRQGAVELGLLNAQAQAAQGNLNTAIGLVNQAVNLKYSDVEAQLTAAQAQLTAIAPLLSKEQATQAAAQQQVLTDKQNQVQDAKDNEKQIQAIALQAAQNGATAGEVAQITGATDVNSATSIAAPYLAKVQTQVVEVNGHSLLIDSQTGKTLQDLGTSNSVIESNIAHSGTAALGGASAVLQPYLKTAYDGTQYVDLSSLTPTDKAQYAQIAAAAGLQPILDAGQAGKINAISDAKTNLQNIQDSLNNNKLLSADNVGHGLQNSVLGAFGNGDVKSYNAWRTAIINNVQALAGGTGSGLRINQAEIDTAMQNDLPVISGVHADSPDSATKKIAILNQQLDTWSKQLLGGGNQAATSGTTPSGITYTVSP